MTFLPISNDDELTASLLTSEPEFTAFAQWHELRAELVPYIGERAAGLFCYAISEASDSLVGTAFFGKALIDAGENVASPQVTETEQLLMDWGRLIATSPSAIPDEMYVRLEEAFNPRLRLILVAFAGLTVATNLLSTLGRIPLDKSLYKYRKPGDERTD